MCFSTEEREITVLLYFSKHSRKLHRVGVLVLQDVWMCFLCSFWKQISCEKTHEWHKTQNYKLLLLLWQLTTGNCKRIRKSTSQLVNHEVKTMLLMWWNSFRFLPVWVWGRTSHWRSYGWNTRSVRLMDKPWPEFPSGSVLAPPPQWPQGPQPQSCKPVCLDKKYRKREKTIYITNEDLSGSFASSLLLNMNPSGKWGRGSC